MKDPFLQATTRMTASDMAMDEGSKEQVNRPSHYTRWPIEPVLFTMLNDVPFAEANIIKYVMRWRDKNGMEDLKKARRYLDMLIAMNEESPNPAEFTDKEALIERFQDWMKTI